MGALGVALTAGEGPAAQATTVTMTGTVPTLCEASFSQARQSDGSGDLDLGVMTRRCNDGAGYRIVLHTPSGLTGAVLILGGRRIALSGSGETVLIDSNTDERVSEPARIVFSPAATVTFVPSLETLPKGPIY